MNYQIQATSFLGRPIDRTKSYVVVGAGISGLLIGYYLKKANVAFKIVEKSDQVGGILHTKKSKYGLVERAANGFIWCPEIQAICDDLNIEILSPRQEAKARYIVKNGQLRQIPLSLADGFRFMGAFFRKHTEPFLTIEDFGHYFFGKKITDQVITPAFAGIYGASLDELSFAGAMRNLAMGFNETGYLLGAFGRLRSKSSALEKKKRSAGTHSFNKGMSEFTNRIGEFLESDIEFNVDGRTLKDTSERLLITAPAYVAGDFFIGRIAELLDQVKYNSMISATMFFNESGIGKFKPGFGCLIPPNEGFMIIGALFNSCILDHRAVGEGIISLTCMIRDSSNNNEILSKTDNEINALILADLGRLFGNVDEPLESIVTRWPRGFPVYSPDLNSSWFEIDRILREEYPDRNLFANYTGDISIRAMAQSAHNALVY